MTADHRCHPPMSIASLLDRGRRLLAAPDSDPVICDLAEFVECDAAAVDALARLQLEARRLRKDLRYRSACRELRDVVALCGLDGVLDLGLETLGSGALPSGPEPGRESEQPEQPIGVEEERDP
jgi:hypothetical protein